MASKASEGAASGIASARERWRRLQLSAFYGPGLSAEAEAICQAACGVRVRRPWTDVDLFEFFLGLPAEQKFPDTQGKSLVKRFLRGRVPDAILDRRDKTVFDEALLAQIDYATLRRLLVDPPYRLAGVDYEALGRTAAPRGLRRRRLPLRQAPRRRACVPGAVVTLHGPRSAASDATDGRPPADVLDASGRVAALRREHCP